MWQYLGKLKYVYTSTIPKVDFGGFITYMHKKIRTIIIHNNILVNSKHLMHIHI